MNLLAICIFTLGLLVVSAIYLYMHKIAAVIYLFRNVFILRMFVVVLLIGVSCCFIQ